MVDIGSFWFNSLLNTEIEVVDCDELTVTAVLCNGDTPTPYNISIGEFLNSHTPIPSN